MGEKKSRPSAARDQFKTFLFFVLPWLAEKRFQKINKYNNDFQCHLKMAIISLMDGRRRRRRADDTNSIAGREDVCKPHVIVFKWKNRILKTHTFAIVFFSFVCVCIRQTVCPSSHKSNCSSIWTQYAPNHMATKYHSWSWIALRVRVDGWQFKRVLGKKETIVQDIRTRRQQRYNKRGQESK